MEQIKVKGTVIGRLIRAGKVVHEFEGNNLVVNAGKAYMASRLVGNSPAAMGYMAIGSSIVSTAVDMTALQGTEHERVAATPSAAGAIYTITGQFGASIAAEKSVAEIGIFNANSAGSMLARFTTTEFKINAGDTLDISWSIQFGE